MTERAATERAATDRAARQGHGGSGRDGTGAGPASRSGATDRRVGQLYPVAKAVLTPLVRFGWRLRVEGLERVPASGGAIVCPNHISVLDSFFLPAVLPRRITYVGKAEYLDSWKTRYLFPALGMIPIDRSGGDGAAAALDAAARLLDAGELFGIYPEGTRSRDGALHKGHTGAARLALRTGCPLVPVGIQGTDDVMPPDTALPRPFRVCRFRIGEPIDVTRHRGRSDDRLLLRQLTDELMYEIRELCGLPYVDSYATRRAETLPASVATLSAEEVGDRPRASDLLRSRPALAAG